MCVEAELVSLPGLYLEPRKVWMGGGGGTWPKITARERVQERDVPPPMHCAEAKLTYILESVWKAKRSVLWHQKYSSSVLKSKTNMYLL